MASYTRLESERIVETAQRLRDRIRERFPDASLARVADRLVEVANGAGSQAEALARSNVPLRMGVALLLLAIPATIGYAVFEFGWGLRIRSLGEFVPFFQAAVESLIFLGAGIAFLVTIEARRKRARTLHAVHELRVLAHLTDMHQLDKDPVYLVGGGQSTASSPERTMTAFELNRYLDYCCELLSLLGKLAALYGQALEDPVAVNAVDQIESLTTGLSRKIWQKTMLIPRVAAGPR